MNFAKKQHVDLSLAQRYGIVSKLKNGEKLQSIAEQYNVDRSTVAIIKKNSLSIKEEFESGKTNVSIGRKKSIRFEDIEQNLFDCFIAMGSGAPGLTGNHLFEKARQIAREEGFDEGEVSALDMN